MQKKHLHLLIGFVLIVLSLYFAFRGVSLNELVHALKQANYLYLFPTAFFVIASYLLRAMRWRFLVSSVKQGVKTSHLFSPLMIGFMANMLPARAGEFVRAYLLSRRESLSFSASFATIFIERLFDLVMVLLLLVWVMLFMPDVIARGDGAFQLSEKVRIFGYTSLAVCLLIFVFSALLQYRNDVAMKIINIFVNPLPDKWKDKILHLVHSFTDGLKILRNPRGFIATVLLSFLVWGTFTITYYPLYMAFDIQNQLPGIPSLLVICLTVAIFITIAPTPGFLGSYHLGCVAALHGIFGVQKAVALSYGIVAWIVAMGMTVLIGCIYAIKENISISAVPVDSEQA